MQGIWNCERHLTLHAISCPACLRGQTRSLPPQTSNQSSKMCRIILCFCLDWLLRFSECVLVPAHPLLWHTDSCVCFPDCYRIRLTPAISAITWFFSSQTNCVENKSNVCKSNQVLKPKVGQIRSWGQIRFWEMNSNRESTQNFTQLTRQLKDQRCTCTHFDFWCQAHSHSVLKLHTLSFSSFPLCEFDLAGITKWTGKIRHFSSGILRETGAIPACAVLWWKRNLLLVHWHNAAWQRWLVQLLPGGPAH